MPGVSETIAHTREEAGQTMVEYAVVLAVITAAIVATISLLASTTDGLYQQVISVL